MIVRKFGINFKEIWDDFVKESKNGHFMFFRDYMEYHSDRFSDHSLLIFNEKESLVAVFPANQSGEELISHQGLSFGGILIDSKMNTLTSLQCLDAIVDYCNKIGITAIIYKKIPSIYSSTLSEEDSFSLVYKGAKLIRRDLSCAVDLNSQSGYTNSRSRNIRKALRNAVSCDESPGVLGSFHDVLTSNLASVHDLKPVHSFDEMKLLADSFPNNIKLFCAHKNGELLAGVLLFLTPSVAHAQYIASSDEGRKVGALDLLFDHLIRKYRGTCAYFSFGVSTEDSGRFINEGLVFQKEGFGARAYVHDFYRLEI